MIEISHYLTAANISNCRRRHDSFHMGKFPCRKCATSYSRLFFTWKLTLKKPTFTSFIIECCYVYQFKTRKKKKTTTTVYVRKYPDLKTPYRQSRLHFCFLICGRLPLLKLGSRKSRRMKLKVYSLVEKEISIHSG